MEQTAKPQIRSVTTQRTQPNGDWKEYASFVALTITLIPVLLSFLGLTYWGGYNSYWGLSDDLFSPSREQSVFSGVIAYILLVLKVLRGVMVAFYSVAFLIFLVMICCIKNVRQLLLSFLKMPIELLRPKLHFSETMETLIYRLYVVLLAIAAPVLLMIGLGKTFQLVNDRGSVSARQRHNDILSGKPSTKSFPSRATLLITNPSKGFDTYSGHLIQTSSTHCALYQKGRGVMIFPLANVARMEIAENNAGATRSMDGKK